mgnify:CR=1 FL=1
MAQPTYHHQDYPKCGSTVVGGEIVGAVFADEAEELAAKKLVADLEGSRAPTGGDLTKDELKEKLIAGGIEVDNRWGVEKMKAELAKLAG